MKHNKKIRPSASVWVPVMLVLALAVELAVFAMTVTTIVR